MHWRRKGKSRSIVARGLHFNFEIVAEFDHADGLDVSAFRYGFNGRVLGSRLMLESIGQAVEWCERCDADITFHDREVAGELADEEKLK